MPEETGKPAHKQFNDPISVAKRSKQKLYLSAQADKTAMLEQIIKNVGNAQSLVVIKSKRAADALSSHLQARGIKAAAVHGNKSAQACEEAVKAFKDGELNLLITTDMILQSLGLNEVAYMLSFDLPSEPAHYLSRIGCIKKEGEAISLVSPEEEGQLYLIERTMREEIPQEELEGFVPAPQTQSVTLPGVGKSQKKKPRHRKQKKKTDQTRVGERGKKSADK